MAALLDGYFVTIFLWLCPVDYNESHEGSCGTANNDNGQVDF